MDKISENDRSLLRICIVGLGGGGFHWEVQRIIQSVKRPLELVLVFSGPGGGLLYWAGKERVAAAYKVKSPSLIGAGFIARTTSFVGNVFSAFRIIVLERPDVVLGVGSAQVIPFAIAARFTGTDVVFAESVTRVRRPSRTARLVNRFGLSDRLYYFWSSLGQQLQCGTCIEEEQRDSGDCRLVSL